MIEYKVGNLLLESVDALVNTVNCVGVMGRGWLCSLKMPIRRISALTRRRARGT
jgi:hypothetical protein